MGWIEYRPGAAAFRRGWTVGLRKESEGAGDVPASANAVANFRGAYPTIEVEEWHDFRYFYVRFRSRQDAALFKLATV
jgi:hypothetical protein